MKTCTKCEDTKPLTDFSKDKYAKDGYYPSCKKCNLRKVSSDPIRKAAYDKEYRKTLGLKKAANQFKVPVEYLENLLVMQNQVCAICRKPEAAKHRTGVTMRLAIDHCHKTGQVRGFLCQKCNHGLGMFLDNTQLLAEAIKYLTKSGS